MPSEQRLHPASILFAFGGSLKQFALPGLVVLLTAGRSSGGPDGRIGYMPANWELWMMLLLIPSALVAIARYLSFRLRYEGTELVIRSGIIFRNERHVPYRRVQNLDAVQNVFHRALGVVEVRVETGGGKTPEATISVLPASAFAEMRRHVFEGRQQTSVDTPSEPAVPLPADTLLHLPLGELLLFGFLENRGLVVIGAVYGVLWELGLLQGIWGRVFDDESYGRGMVREMVSTVAVGERLQWGQIAMVVVGIAGLLIVVRLVSMAWAVVRLYGFRLTRAGEDLRTEFGLFTRVATTIPVRRIQTLTIREDPLQRWMGRVSVRVETAGGSGTSAGTGAGTKEREWLAPIIPSSALPAFASRLLPDLDLTAIEWQPAHPRAFRRAIKPAIVMAVVFSTALAGFLHWRALGVLAIMLPWAVYATRKSVDRLGWAATDAVVIFRSGWLWRSVTVARMAKIQAVVLYESPFDRRAAMARVRVDTAGAGERSHRVDIPYLARETARDLHQRLAAQAAGTAFRW
jgi:putative membrane protein